MLLIFYDAPVVLFQSTLSTRNMGNVLAYKLRLTDIFSEMTSECVSILGGELSQHEVLFCMGCPLCSSHSLRYWNLFLALLGINAWVNGGHMLCVGHSCSWKTPRL